MRAFRLGIGLWAIAEIARTGEWLYIIPGGILLLQAVFNVGCCGTACYSDPARTHGDASQETVYAEEVHVK